MPGKRGIPPPLTVNQGHVCGKSRDFHPPITKSFSFSVPEWRNQAKGTVLRWLYDVPGPVEREEPLDPAHIQREKHYLEPESPVGAHRDEDHHRYKRSKISASWGNHPGLEARRQNLLKSGQNVVRRVSSACQRIITPHGYQDTLDGSTVQGSSSLPGTPTTVVDRPKMRFVFVGDTECGKSSLLLRYYRDAFTNGWLPTQYELFSKTAKVDGQDVDLELWDTSGDINLHQLRLISYLAWDAVFICFSVNSQESFDNAPTKWLEEVRLYCGDVPIFLIGLKKDTRTGSVIWNPLNFNMKWETRIGAGEGSMTANKMGAFKYMECSAKTGDGVDAIFEEGVRAVFEERAADNEAAKLTAEKLRGKRMGQLLCFN